MSISDGLLATVAVLTVLAALVFLGVLFSGGGGGVECEPEPTRSGLMLC